MRKPQSAGHITPQEQRAARRYAAGSLRLRCCRYGEMPRPSPTASTTVRARPRAHHATSPPQRPPRRAATPLALKHTLQQCAPPPPRGASIRRLRVSCSLCLPHTSFTRGNRVKRSGPITCRYGEAPRPTTGRRQSTAQGRRPARTAIPIASTQRRCRLGLYIKHMQHRKSIRASGSIPISEPTPASAAQIQANLNI